MILPNQYVPILKGKEGEFRALYKLPDDIKDLIVPLIDLVPNPQKKFDAQIKSALGYINKWQKERLLYIDGYMIQDYENMSNSQHYMKYIFDELRKKKYNVIPVISNVTSIGYNEQIKNIIQQDRKGVCIRIFRKTAIDMNNELDVILSYLKLESTEVDLLLDLESVEDISSEKIYAWCIKVISELKLLSNWRSFIISGSNFPINLVKLKQDQVHIIARKHWETWKKLSRDKLIERLPTYSDYAISHPQMSELGEGIPNASASIRYTYESDYYIFRGKGTRQHGFEQYFDSAETLIYSFDDYSKEHCAGDEFIYKCGTEKKKKGNLTTWRWVGTNHHITVVVNQLLQFWRDFNAARTS